MIDIISNQQTTIIVEGDYLIDHIEEWLYCFSFFFPSSSSLFNLARCNYVLIIFFKSLLLLFRVKLDLFSCIKSLLIKIILHNNFSESQPNDATKPFSISLVINAARQKKQTQDEERKKK
jgi:hypothetical protein